MSAHPWMKFYPRDWRGDQALRVVSLAARGLWMEMLCVMHEASPYGHLVIADQPVEVDALARASGAGNLEVQALLVELQTAGVFSRTRNGVIFSRRMIADHKRAEKGRKDKLAALKEASENKPENPDPSRVPKRPPPTQKADTRVKVEGAKSPSTLNDREQTSERPQGSLAARGWRGPAAFRVAVVARHGEDFARSWLDQTGWQDVPEPAIICRLRVTAERLSRDLRKLLAEHGIVVKTEIAA